MQGVKPAWCPSLRVLLSMLSGEWAFEEMKDLGIFPEKTLGLVMARVGCHSEGARAQGPQR